ncbi:MAG: 1-deoxy-D-xylulose-5-phosphate reductoisomerase [Propionibacteriales bacterium]|nr:1-deoxy-D-xylulose-5-phosphate reductoisomerase [Propionibacteriales bacterium]
MPGVNPTTGRPRRIVLLGSTGSVGTQALDVIRANPDRFQVVALAAGGSDPLLLAAQALEFRVPVVAMSRSTGVEDLQLALYAEAQRQGYQHGNFALPKIIAGPDAAEQAASIPCDIALNAITGAVGLRPTLAALRAGVTLALANKESLIIGGEVVTSAARPGQIVPVDSEHSALAQCLRGGRTAEVRRLVLTASGGPFRGRSRAQLHEVTAEEALTHPTWDMGPVVTTNSSTLVNKGLEVIEAHLLFGIDYDQIEGVVHPQSIVHSMVEFHDGSTLAQASPPDMRLPIGLALGWPDRLADVGQPVDWTHAQRWDFEPVDHQAFPALSLAVQAGKRGGVRPAIFNAANEVCVDAFLQGRLPYLSIVDTIAAVLSADEVDGDVSSEGGTLTVEDVLAADRWARSRASTLLERPISGGVPHA